MNFLPCNSWERNSEIFQCYISEVQYRKAKSEELNRAEAIDRLIHNFETEEVTWQRG